MRFALRTWLIGAAVVLGIAIAFSSCPGDGVAGSPPSGKEVPAKAPEPEADFRSNAPRVQIKNAAAGGDPESPAQAPAQEEDDYVPPLISGRETTEKERRFLRMVAHLLREQDVAATLPHDIQQADFDWIAALKDTYWRERAPLVDARREQLRSEVRRRFKAGLCEEFDSNAKMNAATSPTRPGQYVAWQQGFSVARGTSVFRIARIDEGDVPESDWLRSQIVDLEFRLAHDIGQFLNIINNQKERTP